MDEKIIGVDEEGRNIYQSKVNPNVRYIYGEEDLTEIIIRLALKDLSNT